MKIVGYKRADFVAKDSGTKITGINLYLAQNIEPPKGKGMEVERYYLTDTKREAFGFDVEAAFGKEVVISVNRYGKLASIRVI